MLEKNLPVKNIYHKRNDVRKEIIYAYDLDLNQLDVLTELGCSVARPRAIDGRQWFLSQSLQGMGSVKVFVDDVREGFESVYNSVLGKAKICRDYCTVLLVRANEIIPRLGRKFKEKLDEFLQPLHMPPDENIYIV